MLVLPHLAAKIGLDEAIILQQIQYWLNKECGKVIDGVRWIYNRLDDWLEQFPWMSKWRLRKAMINLRAKGILEFAQHEKKQWQRRGWYTINPEALHTSMCESTNLRELAEQTIEVVTVHTSSTETSPETPQRQQQQAAAISEPVEEDPIPTFSAPFVDQNEPVGDEPKVIGEDRSSDTAHNVPMRTFNPETEAILKVVDAAGIEIADNPQLQNTVLFYTLDQVERALACYQQVVREKGRRNNPAGWLTGCLKGRWWVSGKAEHKRSPVNPPTPAQLLLLEEMKTSRIIRSIFVQPWGEGEAVVVDDGRQVMPWWELLNCREQI